ncbi:MAG: hypothetical protein ACFE8J_19720 [Candidatus Heimdallarchaeota archaeon]
MDIEEFIKQLNKAQDLMSQEKYKEAIVILEELKVIDKETDLNYNLTHRLYQLYSNCQSLYNQKIILKYINELSKNSTSLTLQKLNQILKNEFKINLEEKILVREIELLILRGLLSCRIEDNKILF